jgi:hypothetical protein
MHVPFLMWDQTIHSSVEVIFSAYMTCDWFLAYIVITRDWRKDSAPSVSTSVAAQHGFPPPPRTPPPLEVSTHQRLFRT